MAGRFIQPVVQPFAAAPQFGLIASSPPVSDQGNRWTGGISYSPEGCGDGEIFGTCEYGTDVTPATQPDTVVWWPYILSVAVECSTFSGEGPDVGELDDRARRLLLQQQETLLGKELWEGNYAQADAEGPPNTWLAGPDADVITTTPATLTHGLDCLEQYLAENNGGKQGMIHATAQTVTQWESFRLLRREGNRILTFKDTIVVPSPGYTGTSPTGTIGSGDIWAYATDYIRVWLDEPKVKDATDRSTNTAQTVAQRFALAEWERCRHGGLPLDMDVCGDEVS